MGSIGKESSRIKTEAASSNRVGKRKPKNERGHNLGMQRKIKYKKRGTKRKRIDHIESGRISTLVMNDSIEIEQPNVDQNFERFEKAPKIMELCKFYVLECCTKH